MPEPASYRTVGVASTFSPRFEQVLAEAKRMRDRFGAELRLIYAGERSDETVRRFETALRNLSLPADTPVLYQQGDPAEAILRVLKENDIELLVAGALEKQVVLHPFLGNVARRLLRESPRSLMLFTHPQREPARLRHLVFITDYSEYAAHALERTLHLGEQEQSERVYVVRLVTTFDEARANKQTDMCGDEEEKLERWVVALSQTEVPMEVRCIRGNTGFAAADFVHSIEADLLVVPAPPLEKGGGLPANLEWLTDVIPCNLWLVR